MSVRKLDRLKADNWPSRFQNPKSGSPKSYICFQSNQKSKLDIHLDVILDEIEFIFPLFHCNLSLKKGNHCFFVSCLGCKGCFVLAFFLQWGGRL